MDSRLRWYIDGLSRSFSDLSQVEHESRNDDGVESTKVTISFTCAGDGELTNGVTMMSIGAALSTAGYSKVRYERGSVTTVVLTMLVSKIM